MIIMIYCLILLSSIMGIRLAVLYVKLSDYEEENEDLKWQIKILNNEIECNERDHEELLNLYKRREKKYKKYVPITERYKEWILMLHNCWRSSWEIGKFYWIDRSTVNKALRKRKKEEKK